MALSDQVKMLVLGKSRGEHKEWVNEQTLAGGAARILTNQSLAKIPETN